MAQFLHVGIKVIFHCPKSGVFKKKLKDLPSNADIKM
jgi:hypothetical protein